MVDTAIVVWTYVLLAYVALVLVDWIVATVRNRQLMIGDSTMYVCGYTIVGAGVVFALARVVSMLL